MRVTPHRRPVRRMLAAQAVFDRADDGFDGVSPPVIAH
jgi:hypothetical protein